MEQTKNVVDTCGWSEGDPPTFGQTFICSALSTPVAGPRRRFEALCLGLARAEAPAAAKELAFSSTFGLSAEQHGQVCAGMFQDKSV